MKRRVSVSVLLVALAGGPAASIGPSHVATGEAAGDALGRAVALTGDVDGDGRDDFIVGAFQNQTGGFGYARVHSGATGALLHAFVGETSNGFFGHAVASAGDVDDDGHDDLVVGAGNGPRGPSGAFGTVFVYSGATGEPLHRIVGAVEGESLGLSVAPAGDLDGDGHDDFLAGGIGRVVAWSGASGAVLRQWTGPSSLGPALAGVGDADGDGTPDVLLGDPSNPGSATLHSGATGLSLRSFTGVEGTSSEHLGAAVSGGGDVDGDGRPDLVVSALRTQSVPVQGTVFVYSGATGEILCELSNDAASFGFAVANAGDVDGDGRADILVGSDETELDAVERVFVYSGATCALYAVIEGERSGDRFGSAVAGGGDANGDRRADLLVGARLSGAAGPGAGRAYLFLGGPPPCADALDNDGDGFADANDAGCVAAGDPWERNPDIECDDGRDNDGDFARDFPADAECVSLADARELFDEAPATVDAGDIVVLDAGPSRRTDRFDGAVHLVSRMTGGQTVLASKGLLAEPRGVSVGRTGEIFVAESSRIVGIDPATNAQRLVTSGGLLTGSTDLAASQDGRIYAISSLDSCRDVPEVGFPGLGWSVVRVDPADGSQEQLDLCSGERRVTIPERIYAAPTGEVLLYLLHLNGPTGGFGGVMRLDEEERRLTKLIQCGECVYPGALAISPAGELFIRSEGRGDAYSLYDALGAFLGLRTFRPLWRFEFDAAGALVGMDPLERSIRTVDVTSGADSLVSSGGLLAHVALRDLTLAPPVLRPAVAYRPLFDLETFPLPSVSQVWLAVRGSRWLRADEIDGASLRLGPLAAAPVPGTLLLDDTDGDGREDLLATFDLAAAGVGVAEPEACLRGTLADGAVFEACGSLARNGIACGLGFEATPFLVGLARRRWRAARRG